MKTTNSKIFYEFKVSVIIDEQISLFDTDIELPIRERKNKIFRQIIGYVEKNDDFIDYAIGSKGFSIKKEYQYNAEIVSFKLAKKKTAKLPVREESFTEENKIVFPNVLIFVDKVSQSLYVEKNYKIFQKPIEAKSILINLLTFLKKRAGIEAKVDFNVNLILESNSFISAFDSFDVVNKIKLCLNSPNSFLGSQKTDEYLSMLRAKTGSQAMNIQIENHDDGISKNGYLSLFGEDIDYVNHGGGSWVLVGKKCGNRAKEYSDSRCKTLIIVLGKNASDTEDEIVKKISGDNRYEET